MAFSLCLALLLLGTPPRIDGQPLGPLVLVSSRRLAAYRHYTRDLATGLAQAGIHPVDIVYLHDASRTGSGARNPQIPDQTRLVVVVGPGNLDRALRLNLEDPILCVYVTRHDFQRAKRKLVPTKRLSAIYLNQPLGRFLSLAKALVPGLHAISTVLSKGQSWRKPRIQQAARRLGDAAHIIIVPDRLHAIFSAFRFVLPGTDALIEFPDETVYNAVTLPTILLRTIHYGVPIISYAPAYVQAGALAAVYTTPAEFSGQTLAWIRHLSAAPASLPRPAYPSRFKLFLNRNIARTLGITLPPIHEILERLRAHPSSLHPHPPA